MIPDPTAGNRILFLLSFAYGKISGGSQDRLDEGNDKGRVRRGRKKGKGWEDKR